MTQKQYPSNFFDVEGIKNSSIPSIVVADVVGDAVVLCVIDVLGIVDDVVVEVPVGVVVDLVVLVDAPLDVVPAVLVDVLECAVIDKMIYFK